MRRPEILFHIASEYYTLTQSMGAFLCHKSFSCNTIHALQDSGALQYIAIHCNTLQYIIAFFQYEETIKTHVCFRF